MAILYGQHGILPSSASSQKIFLFLCCLVHCSHYLMEKLVNNFFLHNKMFQGFPWLCSGRAAMCCSSVDFTVNVVSLITKAGTIISSDWLLYLHSISATLTCIQSGIFSSTPKYDWNLTFPEKSKIPSIKINKKR